MEKLILGTLGSTTLQIVQASVVTYPAKAIVNAANSSLQGGGGVDGAIHRAAGKELAIYNRTHLGRCKTGEAKISPAFNIPTAEYIIHAVGPVYRWKGAVKAAPLLTSCYINSLELAKDLESIAFSGISTGIYGYPLEDATRVAVKTIEAWLLAHPETKLREVTLCAFTPKEYERMKSAV